MSLRLFAMLLLAAASTPAVAGVEEDELARNAVRVVNEMQVIPESAIPDKLLDEARALVASSAAEESRMTRRVANDVRANDMGAALRRGVPSRLVKRE